MAEVYAKIYDNTPCSLGEGALWHPQRRQFFWVDINAKNLHTKGKIWTFKDHVSAAGWINEDQLLIAGEVSLMIFTLSTGKHECLTQLEADIPTNRSNDGRADPWGGFWIGTMAKDKAPGRGAIYRYYKGEIRRLYSNLTIPNAICFSPDGTLAYFTDTPTKRIMCQHLDNAGWPDTNTPPAVFVDTRQFAPDGAVVDADGTLWNAQWGSGRVAGYNADGDFVGAFAQGADHVTCPAFGGDTISDLYCTSAFDEIAPQNMANAPHGQTFITHTDIKGQREHQIIL